MEMTWEQWKAMKKDLRRRFSGTGWTLLIYYIILNASVLLWVFGETVWNMLKTMLYGESGDLEQIAAIASESGWGYFLAAAVGLLILLCGRSPAISGKKFSQRANPWVREPFSESSAFSWGDSSFPR